MSALMHSIIERFKPAVYEWKIPSMSHKRRVLLTVGYVRLNFDQYIINPIIKLIGQYTQDKISLNQIKTARHKEYFRSDIFIIGSYKWYLYLYPNGWYDDQIGEVKLSIALASNPPNIQYITTKYTLSLKEIPNTLFTETINFNHDEYAYSGWDVGTLKLKNIQYLNQLTFQLQILSLIPYNKHNNNPIVPINNLITTTPQLPTTRFVWKISNQILLKQIKNAVNGTEFNSPIFRISFTNWYLRLYPNGERKANQGNVDLYLCLVSLEPSLSQISIRYSMKIQETNTSWRATHHFKQNALDWGWVDKLKLKDIKLLNKVTIIIDILLIDVYNKEGDLMKGFINHNKDFIAKEIKLNIRDTYKWCINDQTHVNQIQNISKESNIFAYSSPIFQMFGVKWCLGFWPNGSRVSRNGTINIFLNLVSLKSNDMIYVIKCELKWIEANKSVSIYHGYSTKANVLGEADWPLILNKCNKYTFKIDISLIDVIDRNQFITKRFVNNISENKTIVYHNLPTMEYVWNISKEILDLKHISYDSPSFKLFGIKWMIQLVVNINNYVELSLNVHNDLFSEGNRDLIVIVRYLFIIVDANLQFISMKRFTEKDQSVSWGQERYLSNNFNTLRQCTIKLKMELVDVYDKDLNVTNQFVNTNTNNNNNNKTTIGSKRKVFDDMEMLNEPPTKRVNKN